MKGALRAAAAFLVATLTFASEAAWAQPESFESATRAEDVLTPDQIKAATPEQRGEITRTLGEIDGFIRNWIRQVARGNCSEFQYMLDQSRSWDEFREDTKATKPELMEIPGAWDRFQLRDVEVDLVPLQRAQNVALNFHYDDRMALLRLLPCPLPQVEVKRAPNLASVTRGIDEALATLRAEIDRLRAECRPEELEGLKVRVLANTDLLIARFVSQVPRRPPDPAFDDAIRKIVETLLAEKQRVAAFEAPPCPPEQPQQAVPEDPEQHQQQVEEGEGEGEPPAGSGTTRPVIFTPGTSEQCSAFGPNFIYDPATDACVRIGYGFDLRLGISYSNVESNSSFGISTVVSGGEESFGAETPDSVDRIGFDAEGKLRLPGSPLLFDGSHYLSGSVSFAGGSESSSGSATIGVDGVTMLGVTFLEADGGTGFSNSTGGVFVEAAARVRNGWFNGGLGYGESFRPGGPGATRFHYNVGPAVELYHQSFSASADIISPGFGTFISQETEADIRDRYFGLKLGGGISHPITDLVSLGLDAYVTPSYRVSDGEISQFSATLATDVSQELDYSDSGFALSGGFGAHVTFHVSDRVHLKGAYEHSWLGGVTEAHVPENPSEQPAFFSSGAVDRNFVKFEARIELGGP